MAAVVMLDLIFRHRIKHRLKEKETKRRNTVLQWHSAKVTEHMKNKCRVCLKDGNIPIFKEDSRESMADNIRQFADIEVTADDDLPQLLCHTCHNLLQGAVLFRQQAQETDVRLRELGVPSETSLYSGLAIKGRRIAEDSPDEFSNNDPSWQDDDIIEDDHREGAIEYKCKKCQLEFTGAIEYVEHLRSELHKRSRVPCPVCSVLFVGTYLPTHMARVHSTEKPFVCEVCGKGFPVRGPFQRHLRIHTDELPFKCSECPYRGRFSESLKMHMRVHTGERPYSCDQCAAQFVCASNLRKHMRTHQEHFDFKCEQCERGFYSSLKLKEHLRVDHTGLKEHQCETCGKAFGYRKQMMKHSRKVHQRPKMRQGRLPIYLEIENKRRQQNGEDNLGS